MTIAQTDKPTPRKPLRLWPGVVAVVLQWLARFGIKAVVPGFKGFALAAQGGLIGAVAIVVWWAFLSRAAWSERLGAIALMIVALGATWSLRHESMGPFWFFACAIPILCLAFVAGAVASRRLADGPRRATMAATVVLACGVWTLVRTEGISGDHVAQFRWRWAKSSEERLLAHPSPPAAEPPKEQPIAHAAAPSVAPAAPREHPETLPAHSAEAKTARNWPGFRGPGRDGIVR